MPVMSAPTQKMYGLPVTAMNAGLPASAVSMADSRLARPPGPRVFGLVWSNPLSNVISAAGRSSPGTLTLRSNAFVTTSSKLTATPFRCSAGSPR
jgi:hypothetical protein